MNPNYILASMIICVCLTSVKDLIRRIILEEKMTFSKTLWNAALALKKSFFLGIPKYSNSQLCVIPPYIKSNLKGEKTYYFRQHIDI